MKELLRAINNKKLTAAFDSGDVKSFIQISTKLYQKARAKQDKIEFLLAECLKRSEERNIEQAMLKFKDIKCQELALEARSKIQTSEKYLSETDPLLRYDMKESAYEEAYRKCIAL